MLPQPHIIHPPPHIPSANYFFLVTSANEIIRQLLNRRGRVARNHILSVEPNQDGLCSLDNDNTFTTLYCATILAISFVFLELEDTVEGVGRKRIIVPCVHIDFVLLRLL